jgi:hypothetical protein
MSDGWRRPPEGGPAVSRHEVGKPEAVVERDARKTDRDRLRKQRRLPETPMARCAATARSRYFSHPFFDALSGDFCWVGSDYFFDN